MENGATKIVKLLLDHVKRLDAVDGAGIAALMVTSQAGHDAVIGQLLGRNANIQAHTFAGSIPLHLAVRGDHFKTCQLSLSYGAEIDTADDNGVTPAMGAIKCDSPEIVELLLGAHVDVAAISLGGKTALHFASSFGALAVADELSDSSTRVNEVGNRGWAPLMEAADAGRNDIVVLLLQKVKINVKSANEYTALHCTTLAGHNCTRRAAPSHEWCCH